MRRVEQRKTENKNRVLAAMFDVRPVTEKGELDKERINQIAAILDLRKVEFRKEESQKEKADGFESIASLFQEIELTNESLPAGGPGLPTREEILAELIRIDEEEESLKLIPDLAGPGLPEFKKEEIAVRPYIADENYFQVGRDSNWSPN